MRKWKFISTFATAKAGKPNAPARMAESVDAPVSNTGGAIHPGSIPGPGTSKEAKCWISHLAFFICLNCHHAGHPQNSVELVKLSRQRDRCRTYEIRHLFKVATDMAWLPHVAMHKHLNVGFTTASSSARIWCRVLHSLPTCRCAYGILEGVS